jgi:hypothetical protein
MGFMVTAANRYIRCWLFCLSLLAGPVVAQTTKNIYPTAGVCGGLPKVDLGTPVGFCVGLVAQGFKFPRGIAPLPNGDLIVADLGGWTTDKGSVWLLERTDAGYKKSDCWTTLIVRMVLRSGRTAGYMSARSAAFSGSIC